MTWVAGSMHSFIFAPILSIKNLRSYLHVIPPYWNLLKLSNLLQEMDVEEGASKDVHSLGKSIVCIDVENTILLAMKLKDDE